jgi:hypothetical protein
MVVAGVVLLFGVPVRAEYPSSSRGVGMESVPVRTVTQTEAARSESPTDGPHLTLSIKANILDRSPPSRRQAKRQATVERQAGGIAVPLYSRLDRVSGSHNGCFGEASLSVEVSEGVSLSYWVWIEDSESGPVVRSRVGGHFKGPDGNLVSDRHERPPDVIEKGVHRSRGGGITDMDLPEAIQYSYLLIVETPDSGVCPLPRGTSTSDSLEGKKSSPEGAVP